jgi:hypothetical protein
MTIPLPITRPVITTTNDTNLLSTVSMIDSYLHEAFQLYKQTGLSDRNQPTYAEPVTIYGYYDKTPRKVMDDGGNLVVCSGMIYFSLSSNIDLPNDYIIYNEERLHVLKFTKQRNFRDTHLEVYIA